MECLLRLTCACLVACRSHTGYDATDRAFIHGVSHPPVPHKTGRCASLWRSVQPHEIVTRCEGAVQKVSRRAPIKNKIDVINGVRTDHLHSHTHTFKEIRIHTDEAFFVLLLLDARCADAVQREASILDTCLVENEAAIEEEPRLQQARQKQVSDNASLF